MSAVEQVQGRKAWCRAGVLPPWLYACLRFRCAVILSLGFLNMISFGQSESGAPANDFFTDVIVRNRFFRQGQNGPSISVAVKQSAGVSCVVYDLAHHVVAYK